MINEDELYPGGFYKLMREQERRRRPFEDVSAVLPSPDVDLDELFLKRVLPPTKFPQDCAKYTAEAKWFELQAEFEGQSALLLLHGMLIAISRRDAPPPLAIDLFQRLWLEKGTELASELSTRWLISAATTFADCGRNGDQRALGMGLTTLFDMIKLHDSERRTTGHPAHKPFRRNPSVRRPPMPFGMAPYSLRAGDLDRVMLSRMWQLCERDATIQPLGIQMLRMVMEDRRTIFGRLQKYKERSAR